MNEIVNCLEGIINSAVPIDTDIKISIAGLKWITD